MALIDVQDEIVAQLNELAQDVYETTPPDDTKLRFDPTGIILPYIVVEFSDAYETDAATGIVSTRFDMKESSIIVSCIGPTERSARQVAGLVRDKLVGFIPAGCTELKPIVGGVTYSQPEAKTNRYISELAFSFKLDTVW